MYHLRLCRARSYRGIVIATKKNPDVYVPEKEQADQLVSSGYFVLVSESENDHLGDGEPETEEAEYEDEHLDLFEDEEREETGEVPLIAELNAMTKVQLSNYAGKKGIDVTGCKTKDDFYQKIIEEIARADAVRQDLRED
jgi:hypothetical protein